MSSEDMHMNQRQNLKPASKLASLWLNPVAFVLLGYAVLVILVFWINLPLLRAGLGIALMLFGSGYSLVAALFPQSSSLDELMRVALAGGLSLAIGGISGFILASSAWGLEPVSLLVFTILFNLVCYAVVVYRRWRVAKAQDSEGQKIPRYDIRTLGC